MTVFEKTEAIVRYAETLVLLGRSAAHRIAPSGRQLDNDFFRYADDFYRRFLCPPLSLVIGFLRMLRGYFFWMVCFLLSYLLASLLLPVAFDVPWDEVERSSAFNYGLLGFSLIFLLFPLPSVLSNSGISNADVEATRRVIAKLGVSEAVQVEAVRANIELREKRMNERFAALRWGSAALWAFLVFFAQRFSGSLLDIPLADVREYLKLLGWFALAILVWFLIVQSYATTMNRALKTVQFALLEQSSEVVATRD